MIGQRIAAQRRVARLSRTELARVSGVSVRSLERLEGGLDQGVRLDTVVALASALALPLAGLLSEPAEDALGAALEAVRLVPGLGPSQALLIEEILRTMVAEQATEQPALDALAFALLAELRARRDAQRGAAIDRHRRVSRVGQHG